MSKKAEAQPAIPAQTETELAGSSGEARKPRARREDQQLVGTPGVETGDQEAMVGCKPELADVKPGSLVAERQEVGRLDLAEGKAKPGDDRTISQWMQPGGPQDRGLPARGKHGNGRGREAP